MRQAGSPVRILALTACLAAGLVTFAGTAGAQTPRALPTLAPAPSDALTEALETGELTEAEYALERARSLFQLVRVRREFGAVARPGPRDATLILRDLAARTRELSGAERAVAERILARPTDNRSVPIGTRYTVASEFTCGADICVHWVESTADGVALTDTTPANGVWDWIDTVRATWENAWSEEIDTIGYREPLDDSSSNQTDGPAGGNKHKLDVYVADLGDDAVFGFCTSDDPNANVPTIYSVSAYCVVDNDYSASQYGIDHTAQEFLEVTSAHEFNHASQFSYDWLDDYWLLEGTATNMEETVYPDVNDNVTFLELWSPLSRPGSPLDRGGTGDSEYGSWIFWRFLQETIAGDDPGIVREIWERADAAFPGVSADDYSLLAVKNELTDRGLVFRDVFAQFGTANRLLDYSDAATAGYPLPPRTAAYGVGPGNPVIRWRSWTINHLATRFFSFTPGSASPTDGRLRVEVRLPEHGARATVIVLYTDDSVEIRQLNQGASGYARWGSPFGRGDVKRVEVVLSNGSTRTASCWTFPGPPSYSCLGRSLDDGRVFKLRAQLVP